MARHQYVTAFVLNADGRNASDRGIGGWGTRSSIAPGASLSRGRLNGSLGALPESLYSSPDSQTIALEPGDRLLLYIDGLLDSRIDEGEQLIRELPILDKLSHLDGMSYWIASAAAMVKLAR
jgi:hypothetical protein